MAGGLLLSSLALVIKFLAARGADDRSHIKYDPSCYPLTFTNDCDGKCGTGVTCNADQSCDVQCPDKLPFNVVEDSCCGDAAEYLQDPAVWKNEPMGVAIGNADGACCVIDAGVSPTLPKFVASASKMVAGYTMLKLVDEGFFKLDTRVADVVDWWTQDEKDIRSKVTIHHLLSQTDGHSWFAAGLAMCFMDSTEKCAKAAFEQSHKWEPGSKFWYSETSFAILGTVAIKATKLPDWPSVVKKYVFDPLKVNTEACFYSTALLPWVDPGASMACSVNEYSKMITAFQNGFISTDLAEKAEKAQTHATYNVKETFLGTLAGRKMHYALGQWRECYNDECLGDEVWTDSIGMYGWYPWKWRKGNEKYWGILARQVPGAGGSSAKFERSLVISQGIHKHVVQLPHLIDPSHQAPPKVAPSPPASGSDTSADAKASPTESESSTDGNETSSTILIAAPWMALVGGLLLLVH